MPIYFVLQHSVVQQLSLAALLIISKPYTCYSVWINSVCNVQPHVQEQVTFIQKNIQLGCTVSPKEHKEWLTSSFCFLHAATQEETGCGGTGQLDEEDKEMKSAASETNNYGLYRLRLRAVDIPLISYIIPIFRLQ